MWRRYEDERLPISRSDGRFRHLAKLKLYFVYFVALLLHSTGDLIATVVVLLVARFSFQVIRPEIRGRENPNSRSEVRFLTPSRRFDSGI